jgi:hypothetical protein
MTPHDPNFWPGFLLIGVPLIALTGGPYGWRFLVLLGALAGLAYAPLISLAVIVLCFLRWPLRVWRSRDHWPSRRPFSEAYGSFQLPQAGGAAT